MDRIREPSKLLTLNMRWRGSRVLVSALIAALISGCASGIARVFDPTVLSTPEIVDAIGSKHDSVLGIHFITTMSLIRGGEAQEPSGFVLIYRTAFQDWSLAISAPFDKASSYAAWLREPNLDLSSSFSATAQKLKAIFPAISPRRYEIKLIPEGASYDDAWVSIAVSDKAIPLVFAISAPAAASDVAPWVTRLTALLAHETSHSYYWFHPSEFVGQFSDEVIAYTVEKCVVGQASTQSERAHLPPKYEELARQADAEPAAVFYAQSRGRYPDSLIAQIFADSLYRRRTANLGNENSSTEFCRGVAHSRIDFSTTDLAARHSGE